MSHRTITTDNDENKIGKRSFEAASGELMTVREFFKLQNTEEKVTL